VDATAGKHVQPGAVGCINFRIEFEREGKTGTISE